MWLLDNDGDVFNGKKLWLRPGKKFIFGRTTAVGGGFVIENKTISRKHLVIELEPVKLGDSMKLDARSKIALEDLNTKIGTLVDGIQIRGQRRELMGDKHEIKLGQYDKQFRITWHPVVLSLSLTSKELKSDPLALLRGKLEPLDIKIIVEYSQENTTHVVAKKRNTSKGLQALINGKHIVDYTFIDNIVTVACSETDGVAPIELDFDSSWPNELDYLPSRGAEPTKIGDDTYAPDVRRQEIFDGYKFIFYDQSQFNNLLAPITNGRGKALLRHVDPSTTKVEDVLRYVKEIAGEKGMGGFEDGNEGKGVVVVRYQPAKGPTLEWYASFGRQLALKLDHRLIEQNEFLDAILNNDASVLRRPLEVEPSGIVAPPSSEERLIAPRDPYFTNSASSAVHENEGPKATGLGENQPSAAPVRRLGRSRRQVTSRFKGFDDDFDVAVIAGANATEGIGTLELKEPVLFVSHHDGMEIDPEDSLQIQKATCSGWRRSSGALIEVEEEDQGDILDQIAPAAANLKRRRLAGELERSGRGEPTPHPPPAVGFMIEAPKARNKKVRREIDVIETTRRQREKEEAIARADREALLKAMHGMEIDQIRNLAVVEDMEVKRYTQPSRLTDIGDQSDRWEEMWNGRKNFKRFKRRGDRDLSAINKVIVPLEEVRKKEFGIADEYWLEGDGNGQKWKKRGGRAADVLAVNELQMQTYMDMQVPAATHTSTQTRKQIQDHSQTRQAPTRRNVEDSPTNELLFVQPSARAPRTRSQGTVQLVQDPPYPSSQRKRRPEPLTKPVLPKKARYVTRDDSDDSEDGLGFKFRKRI